MFVTSNFNLCHLRNNFVAGSRTSCRYEVYSWTHLQEVKVNTSAAINKRVILNKERSVWTPKMMRILPIYTTFRVVL